MPNFSILLAILSVLLAGCSDPITSLETDLADESTVPEAIATAKGPSAFVPGTDITATLRSHLNAGLDVKLPAGHFYVSESIFVDGYSGTIVGAGKDATIIEASPGFESAPDPFFVGTSYEPNVETSAILAIYWSTGNVTIKGLTILVTGDAPADEHDNPLLGPRTTIDNAIIVAGVSPEAQAAGGITVSFMDLRVKGEESSDPLSSNGRNLAYPLAATGWAGPGRGLGLVNAVIKDCEIVESGESAIEFFLSVGGTATMKDNEISNTHGGIWLYGLWGSEVTAKDNRFSGITTDPIVDISTATTCFKDNTLDGAPILGESL